MVEPFPPGTEGTAMPLGERVFASNHPLVQHKLTLLRDIRTEPKKFRELVREISMLLGYEATRDLLSSSVDVCTPLGVATGCRLSEKIGLKGFVGREGSMWIEKAELATVQNTKEIFPNLIVAGMAANGVHGLPRMGPVFGGMFLSGAKAARLALEKVNGGVFKKNNIREEVKRVIC